MTFDRSMPVIKMPPAPKTYSASDQDQLRRAIEQHWHPSIGLTGGGGNVEAFATVLLPLDGGSSSLVDGQWVTAPITFAYNIVGYRLIEDCGTAGSIELRVDYASDVAFPTFTEISGSQRPTLISARETQRTTLDGWTQTTGVSYSQLRATVIGNATDLTRVVLAIALERIDSATTAAGTTGTPAADVDTIPVWSDGAGAPSDANGNDGDYYLNDTNGDVYTKAAGHWSVVANIKGSTGAAGAAGTDGSVWFNGSGVPDPGTGVNGDYYLRTDTSDVYYKSAGSWSVVTNIKGATGATGASGTATVWHDASGVPGAGLGTDGDYYLNDGNGDVYLKAAGAWSVVANIAGPTGATGPMSARSVGAQFDGLGSALALTGTTKVRVGPVPFSGTINYSSIVLDQSGACTIGVKKCARTSYPGSLADITGGADITISGAAQDEDSTLSGWTTTVTADDVFEFELKSVDGTITQAEVLLKVT